MALALSVRAGPPAGEGPLKAGSQSIDNALGTSGVAAGYSRGLSRWLELGGLGRIWQRSFGTSIAAFRQARKVIPALQEP